MSVCLSVSVEFIVLFAAISLESPQQSMITDLFCYKVLEAIFCVQ